MVRRIAADLVDLNFEVVVRGQRIDALSALRGLTTSTAHAEELAEMRGSLQADKQRMKELLNELKRLGVVVHSITDGAIDFPARLANRDVRLCWIPSDKTVSFWHEVDGEIVDRMPIEGNEFVATAEPESSNSARA